MLTHAQIWSAIDRLAEQAGLSASGLARRAGLDPTTFNKSKRMTAEGRARWPSTESIAKALTATGTPVEAFVALMNGGNSGAAPRLRAGRQWRLFRRCRLSGRRGLGPDRISGSRRHARLCAEDFRPVDAAGLSGRRRDPGFAVSARAPRRPRGGENPRRRSDGQRAQAPDP